MGMRKEERKMRTKYIITTDSCADVRKEWCEREGVEVAFFPWSWEVKGSTGLPVEYTTTYLDDFEPMADKFYRGLASGDIVRTSLITKEGFAEFFKGAALKAGTSDKTRVIIWHICMSSGLSVGTWDTVWKGAKIAEKESGGKVMVVISDTKAASLTQRLCVEKAVEMLKEAQKRGRVNMMSLGKRLTEWRREHLFMGGYLGDLGFLQRSGRTSWLKAWAGRLLGLKPMATYSTETGLVDITGMTRAGKKGMKDVWRVVTESVKEGERLKEVIFGYTGEKAKKVAEEMSKAGEVACETSWIGNVSGAHMGPETVYVTWVTE